MSHLRVDEKRTLSAGQHGARGVWEARTELQSLPSGSRHPCPSHGTEQMFCSAMMSGPASKQSLRGRYLSGNISRLSNRSGSADTATELTERNGGAPRVKEQTRSRQL